MKNIWIDPVWSKVIAFIIIGLLTSISKYIYNIIAPLFDEVSSGLFGHKYFPMIFVVLLTIIMSSIIIFILFTKRNKLIDTEIIRLANIYSENQYFYKLFSDNNSGLDVFSLIGHKIEVISLLKDLRLNKLLSNNSEYYPKLNSFGVKIKDYTKKNKLGLFS